MIGANTYSAAYKSKKAQALAVSIRHLEYKIEKETRIKTDLRNIILEEYHNFLDIFSEKNFDTFLFYQKYDYNIILKKQQKHGHAPLYKMSP